MVHMCMNVLNVIKRVIFMRNTRKILMSAFLAAVLITPAVGFAQQALPKKPVEGNAHGTLHFHAKIPSEYEVKNKKGEVVEEVNVVIHAEMTLGPAKDDGSQHASDDAHTLHVPAQSK